MSAIAGRDILAMELSVHVRCAIAVEVCLCLVLYCVGYLNALPAQLLFVL